VSPASLLLSSPEKPVKVCGEVVSLHRGGHFTYREVAAQGDHLAGGGAGLPTKHTPSRRRLISYIGSGGAGIIRAK
jgi:hypothetical protein